MALSEEIEDLIDCIEEIISEMGDSDGSLSQQLEQLEAQKDEIQEKEIDEATEEYQLALVAINDANQKTVDAIQGLATVAETVDVVASAIGKIAAILAMAV